MPRKPVLTTKQKEEVRRKYWTIKETTYQSLADEYGVSVSAIHTTIKGTSIDDYHTETNDE